MLDQKFDWHLVDEREKTQFAKELRSCMAWGTKDDAFRAESWFKVSKVFGVCGPKRAKRARRRKLAENRYLGTLSPT